LLKLPTKVLALFLSLSMTSPKTSLLSLKTPSLSSPVQQKQFKTSKCFAKHTKNLPGSLDKRNSS